jgi:hypothetical protein
MRFKIQNNQDMSMSEQSLVPVLEQLLARQSDLVVRFPQTCSPRRSWR